MESRCFEWMKKKTTVSILEPTPSSIIVVESNVHWEKKDVKAFTQELNRHGITSTIIFLDQGTKLSVLTGKELRELGWIRADEVDRSGRH